ncbi:hypothetical protein EJ076_10030 [Mesorhizobium sp. M7D.F.Ca.US.005.01.1.1]|jgi:hypothetical protein|nr:hypothetical protein EJ076_10030 [Mesorhizobium sp. M7D.F.Ca.US.005.01.1.1]
MVQPHLDSAKAVIEAAALVRQHTMAGTAGFLGDMERSRKSIQTSRDLLRRLRERHRDDMARAWEDTGPVPVVVSAFDADILRSVFRDLILETKVPEAQWRNLARSLVFEFTGCDQTEAGLVDWIISK